jgi:signal transduction histidine kinase
MIEAHGGRISAESAGEGKGSTFGFILPIGKEGVSMGEEALLRDLRPALAA